MLFRSEDAVSDVFQPEPVEPTSAENPPGVAPPVEQGVQPSPPPQGAPVAGPPGATGETPPNGQALLAQMIGQ